MSETKRSKISIIRFIYLYLISAITFIVFLIGAINIVDTGLKTFVFQVDEYDYAVRVPIPDYECERFIGDEDETAYEKCLDKIQVNIEKQEQAKPKGFNNEAKRRLSIGIAQVLVAFPLWIFHWGIIERDRKRKDKK